MLVSGGPGSGKTTIALLKAKQRCATLERGQEVLFLSFSRAAVRQILAGGSSIFSIKERKLVQVETYHRFCLDCLETHGRLLTGTSVRFLVPAQERLRKSVHDGDWRQERARLAAAESLFCFDLLAFGRSEIARGVHRAKGPLRR
ncbi:MAG: UvrD-helicase domain-containing protein [Vicinamibacteria bacterium]